MSEPLLEEIFRRSDKGPVCTDANWNKRIIPKSVKEKLETYGLKNTCTPEDPIPADNGLADRFWEAGFDLAVDVGLLCTDTERRIEISEEEIKARLKGLPKEMIMGSGKDMFIMKAREVEDERPPITNLGPFGMDMSPEYAVPIMMSSAQHRIIDWIHPGVVSEVKGIKSYTRRPIEMLVGKYEGELTEQALRGVDRAGMPRHFVGISDVSSYGWFAGYLSKGTPSLAEPIFYTSLAGSAELKIFHDMMKCAAFAHILGVISHAYIHSMAGGFAGSPEGCVICRIASTLLLTVAYKNIFSQSSIYDIHYIGNCSKEMIWANSISSQAMARNSGVPMFCDTNNPVAGPNTEMILQEAGVNAINNAVDGASWVMGVRSAGGKYTDYSTGLENLFAAEVVHAAAGMKREDANEIVKKIIPKYEDKLKRPPKGNSFPECYDPVRLIPSEEWKNKYLKVKKEFEDLGVPFDRIKRKY